MTQRVCLRALTMGALLFVCLLPIEAFSQNTGACCEDATGICLITTAADCSVPGLTYQGDGTTCNPDPCRPEPDTCDYYKAGYRDYCPNGMPDFDQKQNNWVQPGTNSWSHCGPVALANCFWWFDSKFEPNPIDPTIDPTPNDGYPLVESYEPIGGLWDDHSPDNVRPLVDSLALYCQTNVGGSGTNVFNLASGAQNWLNKVGLGSDYTIRVFPIDPNWGLDSIKTEVLRSQDVILLLGFWQELAPDYCERVGGHYVTVAGTCVDPLDSALCISDPFFDNNEGAGHADKTEHNDAALVSGPHGTNHHDRYNVTPTLCTPIQPPQYHIELAGYPVGQASAVNFYGQNQSNDTPPIDPNPGLPLHTVIEYAIVICPVEVDTGACCIPDAATGTCQILTAVDCEAAGGVYKGDGTVCLGDANGNLIDDICEEPPGACCFDDGSCDDTQDEAWCKANGGHYQGDGVQCIDVDCGSTPGLKWFQPPDLSPEGMDVAAYYNDDLGVPSYVLATDFECRSTGPITEIHIFGSWYHDVLPMGDPRAVSFTLSLHSDIPDPDGAGPEYSMPGDMICFMPDLPFDVKMYASNLQEGWLEPPDNYDPNGDKVCWEYIFYLDGTCIQDGTIDNPIVYWIDLQAYPQNEPGTVPAYFGWKTAEPPHWNDDAVWAIGMDSPSGPLPWNELFFTDATGITRSLDLALAIYGTDVLGACCDDVTGLCRETTANDCLAGNYETYQGDGTSCATTNCPAPDTCTTLVLPGVDLWTTPSGGSSYDSGFSSNPIPADFFGPGSDPFTQPVTLEGKPLTTATGSLGSTDAIVERLDAAPLPTIPSSHMVKIEIIALSLKSVAPITVTYNGGQNPEQWDLEICLSSRPQDTGQMTITRECCDGGTYTATLPVLPRLTFTEVGNPANVRVLDFGNEGLPSIQFSSPNGVWTSYVPPPFSLDSSDGTDSVDPDCDGTGWVPLPPTSNFRPGLSLIPCDPTTSGPGAGKVLTVHQAALAAHSVLPPQKVTPPDEGACCLPDGTCVLTTAAICASVGGTHYGAGSSCFPDPCSQPPTGACCEDQTGICLITTAANCSGPGLTYQGDGTSCTPNPCPQPALDGACCYANGSCAVVPRADCAASPGATYLGDGTACLGDNDGDGVDDACSTPPGACCFDDGTCDDTMNEADCKANGGYYQGDGTQCIDVDCESTPGLKWFQAPDLSPEGMDVAAYYHDGLEPYVLANDFLCTSTGPITEIHIFGSWYHDLLPMGDPRAVRFTLSLHEDIPDPDGNGPEYSMPGEMICYMPDLPFEVQIYASDLQEGWLVPPNNYDPNGDKVCWEYIFYLDGTCIQQGTEDNPIVYWVDLQAYPQVEPGTAPAFFGWKTAVPPHWNDDAVWGMGVDDPTNSPPWNELFFTDTTGETRSLDLAMAIYGTNVLGACCDDVTGLCRETTAADCLAANGETYQGDGTSCTPNPCPQPTGACCYPDGSCVEGPRTDCDAAIGGVYQGDGTSCTPNPCPQPPSGMKWEQLPDLSTEGMDVAAYYHDGLEPYVLANDFLCTSTGPITEIHIFGSWYHDLLPLGDPSAVRFTLSLHTDIPDPDGDGPEYSMPGEMVCYMPDMPFEVSVWASDLQEGWLTPPDSYDPDGDKVCWLYTFYLDGTCIQEGTPDNPIVYWIDLQAYPQAEPSTEPALFGWKTAMPPHWNDDAVWGFGVDSPSGSPQWNELGIGSPGLYVPGDIDGNGIVNQADVDWFQAWKFAAGPPPVYSDGGFYPAADVTGDCNVTDIADLTLLVNYVVNGVGTLLYCPNYPPGGDWRSLDLAMLIYGPPSVTTGACCDDVTGACTVTTPADCGVGFTYQGDGTNCNPNPCPQPPVTGACCDDATGACTVTTRANCGSGHTYQGDGTNCNPNPCPTGPQTGACCYEDGSCADMVQADCIGSGGTYQGAGSKCAGDADGNGIDDACEDISWHEGDAHKMHFPQLPDERGWDVLATRPSSVADDWQCTQTGWVRDIHFWGSWMDGNTGTIELFLLRIYSDIPEDAGGAYSRPGELLWERAVENKFFREIDPPTLEGWYDPSEPVVLPDNHQQYFQYDVILDSLDWFYQDSGTIYWLEISAMVTEATELQWGWKSSLDHFNDNAVFQSPATGTEWFELRDPSQEPRPTFDMAFVITGSCCNFPTMGDVDCNQEGPDIGDITEMITILFINVGAPWCCEDEAELDLTGLVDIGDLTIMISKLFITLTKLPPCPH